MTSAQTLPPNGKCLLSTLWRQDPFSNVVKCISLFAAVVVVIAYPFIPSFLIAAGLDGNWDANHGIITIETDGWTRPMFLLIEKTMGITPNVAYIVLLITIGCYAALIAGDYYLGHRKNEEVWPKHWEVHNTICYHEMFNEPTRFGRLLRRPGNALSNFIYFYTAVCILLSVVRQSSWQSSPEGPPRQEVVENAFLLADGLFGTMLLILSVVSTIFHASNAPNSQYVDLWCMDSCIIFLTIRVISLGLACYLIRNLDMDVSTARYSSGWICAGLFISFIIFKGREMYRFWKRRGLHGHCPFSVRARMSGQSDLFGRGHIPIGVFDVCTYLSLPITCALPTAFVSYALVGSVGSALAQKLAQYSFMIGWHYRIFERFALDGCVPMITVCRWSPSALRTCVAAMLSPTSVLHFWTGITILTAYMHIRSIELCAF